MKAAQIHAYGGAEVIEINANAPAPTPRKNQLLIEVCAASINPVDTAVRAGFLQKMAPLSFPITLGGDFAGVVKQVGPPAGGDFKVGDSVYGQAIVLNGGSGSFAELVVANAANTSHKPKTASWPEVGALPLAGVSAVQAIEEHMRLDSGQKILIHGGAGGIGYLAIQLAKTVGAYVATTVSQDDQEFVKQLGADEVIDYKSQTFENILNDFDAVFDTVGGETTNKSFQVLKKSGILVSMLGQPSEKLGQKYGVTAIGQGTDTNTQHLNRLAELVDSGDIKVHVDKVFSLEQVKDAFNHQENGHPRGKVVIKIK